MNIQIAKPRMIICEGKADVAFFEHLIVQRGLPEFQVIAANGNSGYQDLLDALSTAPGFDGLSGILVVGDNDLNPAVAFQKIRAQIQAVGGYGVPGSPRTAARNPSFPPVVILMIPWDDTVGCLETVLLEAVSTANPELRRCADAYAACGHADTWTAVEQSKMRLQSLTAMICRTDPTTPVSYAWSRQETIVPLTQPCFDQVVDFLRAFPQLVG